MSGDPVLNHAIRKRIYEHIMDHPGITFTMLRSVFDLNDGTLNYHLDYLRRNSLIEIRKSGNRRMYIPKERNDPEDRLERGHRRILRIIRGSPGITHAEIVESIGMDGPETRKVLSSLMRRRIVRTSKTEGRTGYELAEKGIVDRMVLILLERYIDGEISYDRFVELKKKLESLVKE